jgi:mannosyl-3-phosphoglycerate phosphatase
VLVSDVDGTLLDATGRWALPPAALRATLGIVPLVLASSRTLAELRLLHRVLRTDGAGIAENGALLTLAADGEPVRLGQPAAVVRARLRAAAAEAAVSITLAEEADADTRAARGLGSRGAFRRAVTLRQASVLLVPPRLAPAAQAHWEAALAEQHLEVTTGGRWAVATIGATKGIAARLLRRMLERRDGVVPTLVGAGNDENDCSLLLAVDRALVVRDDQGRLHPLLATIPHAEPCPRPGVAGLGEVLRRLALPEGVLHG